MIFRSMIYSLHNLHILFAVICFTKQHQGSVILTCPRDNVQSREFRGDLCQALCLSDSDFGSLSKETMHMYIVFMYIYIYNIYYVNLCNVTIYNLMIYMCYI